MTMRYLLVIALVLVVGSRLSTQAQQPARQSAAEVRKERGRDPDRVARQIVSRRYVEQWEYDNPPARYEFNHLIGAGD